MNNDANASPIETEDDPVVIEDNEELTETVVLTDVAPTDNVGDVSVEINVEQLIADIEGEKTEGAAEKKDIRRKLEELEEAKSIEDTYSMEFDPD